MYVRDYPRKLEDYLHLVEFVYNNHYQTSTKLSPFEILYGRKCNTPITRSNPVDRFMLGPDLLKELKVTNWYKAISKLFKTDKRVMWTFKELQNNSK